jgi:hypothetical protein
LGNELLQTHQQQRKAAGQNSKGTAPRFERLMDRLNLTDKERLAMLYVLVKQVSQEDFSNLFPKFGRSPPSFAAFAGLVSIGMLPCRPNNFTISCSQRLQPSPQPNNTLQTW